MSIQSRINPLDATPIKESAAVTRLALDERPPVQPHSSEAAPHQFPAAVLSVLRFIAAAYATGEAECWEAAFRFADDAAGNGGPLLVARVATLVRLIRRHHDPVCLPASCGGLSADERRIMMLIGLAREQDDSSLPAGTSALMDIYRQDETLISAARSLAELADAGPGARTLPDVP